MKGSSGSYVDLPSLVYNDLASNANDHGIVAQA